MTDIVAGTMSITASDPRLRILSYEFIVQVQNQNISQIARLGVADTFKTAQLVHLSAEQHIGSATVIAMSNSPGTEYKIYEQAAAQGNRQWQSVIRWFRGPVDTSERLYGYAIELPIVMITPQSDIDFHIPAVDSNASPQASFTIYMSLRIFEY